jgi:uncharacterized protein (TIGR02147 family)
MISPLGYLDYRAWLRDLYEERRRTDAFFSYRFMAGKVGTSHSFLIRVFQGQKHLAEETVDRFVGFLLLDDRQAEYFRTLVRFGRTTSEIVRRACLERLLALQAMRMTPLELEGVDYFSGWVPAALRSLAPLHPKARAKELSEQLVPAPPVDVVEGTLNRLVAMGLLRQENGRWAVTEYFVEPGKEIGKLVIRNYQREILRLATEALERHAPEDRYIASATFSIDPEDLAEAHARLRSLRDSLLQLSEGARRPGVVMNLGLALYPVSKSAKTGRSGRPRARS